MIQLGIILNVPRAREATAKNKGQKRPVRLPGVRDAPESSGV
ncbi:hypothetical protein [Aquabacterium sp. G14]